MPSASAKTTEASDPLRQAIVIVEHKIRNLEKRKSKLDSYKESGKPLTREQQEAVSKYEEVMQQLELSKEYVKQFTSLCLENDKLRKKAAKKEALERTTAETAKIKQVLLIQDVLQNMGTDQAREDFLAGRNGALTLTEADLKNLDDLYVEVSPKHEGSVPFLSQVQKAAENFMTIVDGRGREVAGSTGAKLQALVASIHACGYFDQHEDTVNEQEEGVIEKHTEESEVVPPVVELAAPVPQETPMPVQQSMPPNIPAGAPMHPLLQNIVPVSQVESSLFNAQGFQPPTNNAGPIPPVAIQNSAPINFTFFQESELEAKDLAGGAPPSQTSQQPLQPPAAIPSRTFTNQGFNGQPASAPMGYPPAPAANRFFVGGFQPPAPPHFYPPNNNVNGLPAMQEPRPATDTNNRGFPQPPPQIGNAYNSQSGAPPTGPPAPLQTFQPAPVEEPVSSEEKKVEEPRQDWAASERLDWGNEEFAEWNPQGSDNKKPRGDRVDRSDRPRNNYQGNGNRRNNSGYSNNRQGHRDRESGNYYNNNQNGYRGNNDYQRDGKDRNDVNGGFNGYRGRGSGPRGPRSDRADRPQGNSGPRNNSGPRPPRNNNRGAPGQHNSYRQEPQEAK